MFSGLVPLLWHEAGIRAIGVPIQSANGTALAALSTAAPAYRADVELLLEFLPALVPAAREICLAAARPLTTGGARPP